MSQYILILSVFFMMFSIQRAQQLLCPNSCECILGGQEIKCDGSKADIRNMTKSLKTFQMIELLRLKNFETAIDKDIYIESPVKEMIIKNSDTNTLFMMLNKQDKSLERLTLINMINIKETWDLGAMFGQLTQLKDFQLECSSKFLLKDVNIEIGHELECDLLTVSLVGCQIQSINGNVFNKWSNLRMISLANNSLVVLHRNWFHSDLKSLWSLDLSFNSISSIPENFFNGMPALRKLRLDNNHFETLNYDWFDLIWSQLQEFWINRNLIKCSRDLIWVTSVTFPYFFGEGVCYSSLIAKIRLFNDLRNGDEELDTPLLQ